MQHPGGGGERAGGQLVEKPGDAVLLSPGLDMFFIFVSNVFSATFSAFLSNGVWWGVHMGTIWLLKLCVDFRWILLPSKSKKGGKVPMFA